ncbi:hypothetical protein [Streptomyces sp. NPDC086023]|uniref:DUF7848 domain-containing protein n=1 Tax=Streptomyces sp. NPDC086023 TaxID=3365746 RepID=UPI0037CCE83F
MSARVVVPVAVDTPADRMVTPDRRGSGPIVEVECTTCLKGSGAVDDELTVTAWCVAHARREGHTGFRRIVTDFLRVMLSEPPRRSD